MKGSQLENIITRFYYKQKELYFQIILQLKDKQIIYNEYSDYLLYKAKLEELLEDKKKNNIINIDSTALFELCI